MQRAGVNRNGGHQGCGRKSSADGMVMVRGRSEECVRVRSVAHWGRGRMGRTPGCRNFRGTAGCMSRGKRFFPTSGTTHASLVDVRVFLDEFLLLRFSSKKRGPRRKGLAGLRLDHSAGQFLPVQTPIWSLGATNALIFNPHSLVAVGPMWQSSPHWEPLSFPWPAFEKVLRPAVRSKRATTPGPQWARGSSVRAD